jgi:uncharacterized membrane protein YuzA (DUF378 family)
MDSTEASSYNLYFIVRSIITASIGFTTFSLVALMLGNMSGTQAIAVSFISFAYPLLLTKIFHKRIRSLVRRVLNFMQKHKQVERLVMKILE